MVPFISKIGSTVDTGREREIIFQTRTVFRYGISVVYFTK